jgi:regulation of enolase protein 1 (concanavalin A-like superfamily)
VVLDRFTVNAPFGTDQWDRQDNAPTRTVQVLGDFRATVGVNAATVRNVQVVGLGVRHLGLSDVWLRITKGFSTDFNPPLHVGVQRRRGAAEVLQPVVPYAANEVHFMIERRGTRFTLSFGPDGRHWTAVQQDLDFGISRIVEVYAVAYSNYNDAPLAAEFSNLTLTPP